MIKRLFTAVLVLAWFGSFGMSGYYFLSGNDVLGRIFTFIFISPMVAVLFYGLVRWIVKGDDSNDI